MQIELSTHEHELLLKVLSSYRGDLREEIYKTEVTAFKHDLKAEQELLEGLLERLKEAGAAPAR